MRYEPHYTHEADPGKFVEKETTTVGVRTGDGRMPKRKRQPPPSQGGAEGAVQPPFVFTPDVEEDDVIEPRTTDVLFGRGDNINR